jgi:putative methyltransferase (TIGR04325 family)
MKNLNTYLKLFLPSIITNLAGRHLSQEFEVNRSGWQSAIRDSSGYDKPDILRRVCESALKVKTGEAVYERDSVLFEQIQYSWPLLCGLLKAAINNNLSLVVLDFGGSLGSSYFQNRGFFSTLKELRWCIVEQPTFVEIGKKLFENEELAFYQDIGECQRNEHINVAVVSGVLQYLEFPHHKLEEILDINVDMIILDRTPFLLDTNDDLLTIQKVPPSIYDASYPHWFFARSKLVQHCLDKGYSITAEWDGFDNANIKNSVFKGLIFEKK